MWASIGSADAHPQLRLKKKGTMTSEAAELIAKVQEAADLQRPPSLVMFLGDGERKWAAVPLRPECENAEDEVAARLKRSMHLYGAVLFLGDRHRVLSLGRGKQNRQFLKDAYEHYAARLARY
jgi:hypothetical protein